ncbi:MAG: hypothetical protein JST02_02915 [Bacteroidetes bacterium]|nr:hypothetical protein [Bacteroidota bacterium]
MKQFFLILLLYPAYTLAFSQILMPIAEIPLPEEIFIDSTHIGKKGHNKIELLKYRISDSNYVVINFYTKSAGKWKLQNKFEQDKDDVLSCEPEISDFNNDKLNDFTYVPALAARGANKIRRLFIYDIKKDQLIYIKNSDEYPNLLYNNQLNCIDAFLVYGGCETVFLKLQGDSLKEFASVELSDGLTVTTYDSNGREKVIYRNKKIRGSYVRYKNYKPLKEYEDY